MKKQDKGFKTSRLYMLAEEYRLNLVDEEEIIKRGPITDLVWEERLRRVKKGELIREAVVGRVRTGKSTWAIATGQEIKKLIVKYDKSATKEKFGIRQIARDQSEYIDLMLDQNFGHDIVTIDEWNELENTGLNATTEQATLRTITDIHAGRYIHTIKCSPRDVGDIDADLVFDIKAIDRDNMLTRAKVYLKYYEQGQDQLVFIGLMDTYVGDLIMNWEKRVKKLFFKKDKTPEQEKLCKELIKKDFYSLYQAKKYEKMEMMTKHGIFRPRLLQYAPVILKVITRLEPLAKAKGLIKPIIIKNYVQTEMRLAKFPNSTYTEDEITRIVAGYMELHKEYYIQKSKVGALYQKVKANPEKFEERYNEIGAETREIVDDLKKQMKYQKDEFELQAEIYRKYKEI